MGRGVEDIVAGGKFGRLCFYGKMTSLPDCQPPLSPGLPVIGTQPPHPWLSKWPTADAFSILSLSSVFGIIYFLFLARLFALQMLAVEMAL